MNDDQTDDATNTDDAEHTELDDATGDAASDDPTTIENGFAALGLRDELLSALDDLGYEEPTPIQRETIPTLLTGRDLLGQAATGTGKTAAFALPALQMIDASRREPQVLVLVPTRELAVQVSEAMFKYGRELGVKVVPVFGGQPIQRQLQALDRGVHVVVATPGRALDHIGRGSLGLDAIRTVILDEADEMLDMGFTDDIESILESTPEDRQTVLFSATMPKRIISIAKRYQRDPERITIGRADSEPGAKALVRQTVYVVQRAHKPSALGRILDIEAPKSALVFCRTRNEVDQLTETMNARGYRAEALHGGMDQGQRDRVMARLPRRHRRAARRDRRRSARSRRRHAHPCRQLRRPVGRRELRAPHRPRRPSRTRGCGDHPGRAARAARPREHRTAHQAEVRDRQGADGVGPP